MKKWLSKHKGKFIGLALILILPIVIYFAGGHKFIDNYLAEEVRAELNTLIENEYTESIKAEATSDDLESVQGKIRYIYDPVIKGDLLNNTESIRSQIELQTSLKETSDVYYATDDPSEIDEEHLKEIIDLAGGIRNDVIRSQVYQQSYDVLDRLTKTNEAKTSVNNLYNNLEELSLDDMTSIYVAKGQIENVYYDSVQDDLRSKMEKIEERLSELLANQEYTREELIRRDVEAVSNGEYVFNRGSSTVSRVATNLLEEELGIERDDTTEDDEDDSNDTSSDDNLDVNSSEIVLNNGNLVALNSEGDMVFNQSVEIPNVVQTVLNSGPYTNAFVDNYQYQEEYDVEVGEGTGTGTRQMTTPVIRFRNDENQEIIFAINDEVEDAVVLDSGTFGNLLTLVESGGVVLTNGR